MFLKSMPNLLKLAICIIAGLFILIPKNASAQNARGGTVEISIKDNRIKAIHLRRQDLRDIGNGKGRVLSKEDQRLFLRFGKAGVIYRDGMVVGKTIYNKGFLRAEQWQRYLLYTSQGGTVSFQNFVAQQKTTQQTRGTAVSVLQKHAQQYAKQQIKQQTQYNQHRQATPSRRDAKRNKSGLRRTPRISPAHHSSIEKPFTILNAARIHRPYIWKNIADLASASTLPTLAKPAHQKPATSVQKNPNEKISKPNKIGETNKKRKPEKACKLKKRRHASELHKLNKTRIPAQFHKLGKLNESEK